MSRSHRSPAEHARCFIVMITAGTKLDEVVDMARAFGVRAVTVQQLAVPAIEETAQRMLADALRAHAG